MSTVPFGGPFLELGFQGTGLLCPFVSVPLFLYPNVLQEGGGGEKEARNHSAEGQLGVSFVTARREVLAVGGGD